MKQAAWAILVILIFAPCVKADTFDVTAGYFQPFGAVGNNLSFSGNGFTAVGNIQLAPFGCHEEFLPGQPILGCETTWVSGVVTITAGNIVEQVEYGFDYILAFTQDPMVPATTLQETATIGTLHGCINEIFFPNCTGVDLLLGNAILTMNLVENTDGGWTVESERYDIVAPSASVPEPNSLLLLALGLAALAIGRANRPLTRALYR